MLRTIATKIFGSRNDRVLRRLNKIVVKINKLEPEYESLSDEQLKAKTAEFRDRLAQGATLESLMPEAFATVREASLACVISTCNLSAVWCLTVAVSRKCVPVKGKP